jgi:methionyl-tRNA formyltransferase
MATDKPRLVFAGTPDFAARHLQSLLQHHFHICAVYTQPDRPAGRGKKLMPSPVKQLATSHDIPVFQPDSLKEPAVQHALSTLHADLMIVVAYGLLLPQVVLDTPRLGCINVHASRLPRWRGAAPIQRAIAAGDKTTGVCIMQMDAGLDTGPVLATRQCEILSNDTGGSLHDKLAELGSETLIESLPSLLNGQLTAMPQSSIGVSYAHKLSKEDARLDFKQSAHELENKIKAFNPFPVSWCSLPDQNRLRIWNAQAMPEASRAAPGTLLGLLPDGLDIACGGGTLRLTEIQLPNRNRMPVRDILNGHLLTLQIGDSLT